jgi:methyltransferase (TIGR00027 family)
MRADGMRQVVILGSGLDLLGRRLAFDFSESTVFETDRTDSITMKETLLGTDRPRNLELLRHDLNTTSIEDALASARGFRKDLPTMVIAEGVFMYCPLEEVRQLFVSLQSLMAKPIRLVFTFMELDPSGRVRFRNQNRFVTWWLARSGEPFLWGMPVTALRGFLNEAGFELEQAVSTAEYVAEHELLPPEIPPPARGELIAAARTCNDEH